MTIKLLIADTDRNYSERLVSALVKSEPSSYDISIFSKKEEFESIALAGEIDVLLISPLAYADITGYRNAKLVILLTDINYSGDIDIKEQIYKYQRITDISAAIRSLYLNIQHNNPSDKLTVSNVSMFTSEMKNDGNIKIITLFNASGGSGGTTVAMALAMRLASTGRKTLFLNFESCCSHIMFEKAENGMTEILETMRRDLDIGYKLEAFINEHPSTGVMYFSGFDSMEDLFSITAAELRILITGIIDLNRYDAVVIDAGCFSDERAMALFEMSRFIYFVIEDSEISIFKAQFYLSNNCLFNSFISKLRVIYNKTNSETSKDLDIERLNLNIAAIIPKFTKGSFVSVVQEISQSGCFDFI